MIKVTNTCDGCGKTTTNLNSAAWVIDQQEGNPNIPSPEKKPPKYHLCPACAAFGDRLENESLNK